MEDRNENTTPGQDTEGDPTGAREPEPEQAEKKGLGALQVVSMMNTGKLLGMCPLFEGMRGMRRVFQGAATVDSVLRGDLVERAVERRGRVAHKLQGARRGGLRSGRRG